MSISCECDNPPEFWSEVDRVARTEHTCCECGKAIKPGDPYRYISGKWDEFYNFKHCENCADLWDSMMALGFCLEYGNLQQDHADYIDLYEPPKLRELRE